MSRFYRNIGKLIYLINYGYNADKAKMLGRINGGTVHV